MKKMGQLYFEIKGLAKPNGSYLRNPLRVARDPGSFLVPEFLVSPSISSYIVGILPKKNNLQYFSV
jgi:hypothetical protein